MTRFLSCRPTSLVSTIYNLKMCVFFPPPFRAIIVPESPFPQQKQSKNTAGIPRLRRFPATPIIESLFYFSMLSSRPQHMVILDVKEWARRTRTDSAVRAFAFPFLSGRWIFTQRRPLSAFQLGPPLANPDNAHDTDELWTPGPSGEATMKVISAQRGQTG